MRLSLLVGLTSAAAPGTAAAQAGEQAFKDWALRCEAEQPCRLEHRVFLQGQPDAPILVMAFQSGGAGQGILGIIRVPMDVLLPSGLKLLVDGTQIRDLAYHHCLPNGCVAVFELDTALRSRLERGIQAKVGFQLLDGRQPTIPLTLLGVTAGLRSLDEATPR